jgi:hypothetical protein
VLSKNPLPKNNKEQKAMAKAIHSAKVERKAEAKRMAVEMCDSMKTCSDTPYPLSASGPRYLKKQQVCDSSNTNSTSDTSILSTSSTPIKEAN